MKILFAFGMNTIDWIVMVTSYKSDTIIVLGEDIEVKSKLILS